jgi:Na+-transporting NADH:ubiquinone oxidoreductase subunit A
MGVIKIKKGLNVPISGEPEQVIYDAPSVSRVAVLGHDFVGMKPTMEVAEGDSVKLGQPLFTDKKMPSIKYTSPGAGRIAAILRGDKRALVSVVVQLEGDDHVHFDFFAEAEITGMSREKVKQLLIDSGLWVALRARPFSRVANPDAVPHSIFVTAMDTNPLAPSVETILQGRENDFQNGLKVLSRLTDSKVYLCQSPGAKLPTIALKNLAVEQFDGPHPAGLAGTHIHFLDPVSAAKTVWHIGAQDVTAVGKLFTTGRLDVERVISLAGPSVKKPRLLRTRLGASLAELTQDELTPGNNRVISGSVLSGFAAAEANSFLGRYHQQATVLREGGDRHFLGWMSPGFNLFSIKNIVASKLFPHKKFAFTTAVNGGPRAIVPSGSYEAVMPLDILPTPLLRMLAIHDVEESEKLGCFELDEEDLALCTYVCPSKIDHGQNLRDTLTLIEKEG